MVKGLSALGLVRTYARCELFESWVDVGFLFLDWF